jgi:hypothetical protein
MTKIIGVIAEDNSDIDVIYQIFSKYMNENEFKIKKFIGNGCGKLKSKCDAWTDNLFKSGCQHVFIFHDQDRECKIKLRKKLEKKVCPKKYSDTLIVIPVEELESWLLADENAIKNVFNLNAIPKKIQDCENIASPKEHLRDLVWRTGKKRYLNTIHNKMLAKEISLINLRRCSSYSLFDEFVSARVCT